MERGFRGVGVERLRGGVSLPTRVYVVTRIFEARGQPVLAELTGISINQHYRTFTRYPTFNISSDRIGSFIQWYHHDGPEVVERIFEDDDDEEEEDDDDVELKVAAVKVVVNKSERWRQNVSEADDEK